MKLKYGPYSPSRLETATCGYAFYRQYIDPQRKKKESSDESLPQARGAAVHEVLEKITQRMVEDRNACFSGSDIRDWVQEAINRHPRADEETGDIIKMCKLYVQQPPKLLTSDAQTELRLAVKHNGSKFVECDYDDADAYARGRADIFMLSDDTTSALIYDHKTQMNIEHADTFQLGFYAWVIFNTYPFLDEIKTVLHFARFGYYSEEHVWTRKDLQDIEDEILTRIQVVENTTEWAARSHKNCQYCPFVTTCPKLEDCIEVSDNGCYRVKKDNLHILGSLEKAIQVAGFINILEEALSCAKESLRGYVKASGPVAIPGKVYEFRGDESVNWDKVNKMKEDVYKVFEKHGVDPRRFMGFSQTFSKSVWVADKEELVRELSALLPKKVSTEFRGYKI